MPYIVHIDPRQLIYGDADFEEAFSQFLSINSKNSYLVQNGELKKINQFQNLKDVNPWKHYNDNKWLICNKKRDTQDSEIKELINSSNRILTNFDKHSQKLIKSCDWVIFTNFTTYKTQLISFVTNSEEQYENYHQVMKSKIPCKNIICYNKKETSSKDLRHLTFYDYGMEGYYASLLSQLENSNPYLICCFEVEDEEYRKWDNDLSKHIDSPWFLKHFEKLTEMNSFSTAQLKYKIFEVTNEEHYLEIWSMTSDDLGIADYVISGLSNIDLVIDSIKNNIDIDLSTVVPWGYTQIYGGGSDEHHAYFHSLDGKATEFIYNIVSDTNDLIARF